MSKKKTPVKLDEEEIDLILSGLSFFMREYPDKSGSVQYRKDMEKLTKKLWRIIGGLK